MNDLAATGTIMANDELIAYEGIECFDISIDPATCLVDAGIAAEGEVCIFDKTRKHSDIVFQCSYVKEG